MEKKEEVIFVELSDHLGNVHAVVSKDGDNLEMVSISDFYPFGMEIPGRLKVPSEGQYRFDYQGQFAERDEETGYSQFEARLFDARIGRWMVCYPSNQFHSPYLGMGNNPVLMVDENGEVVDLAVIAAFTLYGIIVGGLEAGFNSMNYGYSFWEEFGKGALVGGLTYGVLGYGASAFGAAMGITGAIPGMLYGAGSGAIVGGISGGMTSWAMGGNFSEGVGIGAKWGAIGGAIFGGIGGYFDASDKGLNPWTGGERKMIEYYITDDDLLPVKDIEKWEHRAQADYAKGLKDTRAIRRYELLENKINNQIGIDCYGNVPRYRDFYLGDWKIKGDISYSYRDVIPQGYTVILSVDEFFFF